MKDSTRASLHGAIICIPFVIGCIILGMLSPFVVTFLERLTLLIPLVLGLGLSFLAYRKEPRFKHYLRESLRSTKEFDENYRYEPEGAA